MISREDVLQDTRYKNILVKRNKKNTIYQNVDEFGQKENSKMRFIDTFYPDEEADKVARDNLKQLFYHAYEIENQLQKDIYEFSLQELEGLLYSFRSSSISSMEVRISLLKKYIDFCIRRDIRTNSVNFLDKPIDAVKFVSKNVWKNKYPTKETLLNICQLLSTAQLAVLLILPFMGILGKNAHELRYLKEEDVDLENKLIYVREYEDTNQEGKKVYHPERIVKIDDEFVPYIKRAMQSTIYTDIRVNGTVLSRDISPTNPYVVKRTKRGDDDTKADEALANSGVNARYFALKNSFQGDFWLVNKLSPVTLEYSAMIEELREVEAIQGKVTLKDYQNVMVRHQRNSNSYSSLKKMYEQIRKDEIEEQELMEIKSRLEDVE